MQYLLIFSVFVSPKQIAEKSFIEKILNLEMMYVCGDAFTMGATREQWKEAMDNEKPAHKVTVSNFYIGKYEVTVGQFRQFITSSGYKTDAEKGLQGFYGSFAWDIEKNGWNINEHINWRHDEYGDVRKSNEENQPVIHVSWNDANEFVKWLNKKTGKKYRLPTEAEWEFAVRGGNRSKGFKYSGSNNIWEVAWYGDNSENKTHAVGLKAANELGIHDMSGNVWEWCGDWFEKNYYSKSPTTNPKGPSTGLMKVLRGGSWIFHSKNCRISSRIGSNPENRYFNFGFRLACSAK